MIERRIRHLLDAALSRQAAVALIGPRQVGKTTLALELARSRPSLYLDLESPSDRRKLSEPELFLRAHADELVILDEIHRVPELFPVLRGLIDRGRAEGKRTGRFLILGSAAIAMLRQSGETLAGRIEFVDMGPFDLLETDRSDAARDRLWLRGGFPDSTLAASDADRFRLRQSFIRTYLERDIAQFGPRIPSETLGRLWTMLAHNQGGLLNASRLAAGLAVSAPTVARYVDLLVDLLLVRRLAPLHANTGKRMVKSPKVYVRDSGLLHALLGIRDRNDLAGHPVVGPSWEGFVIENLLSAAPEGAKAGFHRTSAGAEIDLLLELGGRHGVWAIEIKRGLAPKAERGFHLARLDLAPAKSFVVYSGPDRYPLAKDIEAISLRDLAGELAGLAA